MGRLDFTRRFEHALQHTSGGRGVKRVATELFQGRNKVFRTLSILINAEKDRRV